MTTEPTTSTPAASSTAGWRVRSNLKEAWLRLSRTQKALASLGLVLLVLPVAGSVVIFSIKGVKSWEALGKGAFGMGLTMLIVLGIFYAIFQRKHRAAAWTSVVFLLLCGTCFSGIYAVALAINWRDARNRAELQRVAAALQHAASVQDKHLQSGSYEPEVFAANISNMLGALDAYAGEQKPSLQAALQIIRQHIQLMSNMKADYRRSFQALKSAGGLSPHTMSDSSAVGSRLQLLADASAHLERIRKAQRTMSDDLRQQMNQARIPEQEIDAILLGLSIDEQTSLQFLTFDLEAQALQCGQSYMLCMQRNAGRWRINENQQIEFLDGVAAEDIQTFNDAYQQLVRAAQQQRIINERIVKLTRERAERLAR